MNVTQSVRIFVYKNGRQLMMVPLVMMVMLRMKRMRLVREMRV